MNDRLERIVTAETAQRAFGDADAVSVGDYHIPKMIGWTLLGRPVDDAVMLDHRGFIAETNATHIFMVSSGGLLTPTTASCPEGITRATVLELAASAGMTVAEGDYTLPQLYNAAEVFVTGTMGGLAPVVAVDGRVIGDGDVGPVTKQLREAYLNLTATTGTVVA